MFEYPVEPNQKVITEGDDGDNFYVIENGVYDVIKVSFFDFVISFGIKCHSWLLLVTSGPLEVQAYIMPYNRMLYSSETFYAYFLSSFCIEYRWRRQESRLLR